MSQILIDTLALYRNAFHKTGQSLARGWMTMVAVVGFGALLMLILAPIAAVLIQLAVSRSREYQADETGAHFTGNPYALASALAKLDAYSKRVPLQATPSTAHLFIIQPFLGVSLMSLFQTHPPIAKRIERLTGRPAEFSGLGN